MDLINLSLGTGNPNTVHRYSRPWQATRLSLARQICCREVSRASWLLQRIKAARAACSGVAAERISHPPIPVPFLEFQSRVIYRESASP